MARSPQRERGGGPKLRVRHRRRKQKKVPGSRLWRAPPTRARARELCGGWLTPTKKVKGNLDPLLLGDAPFGMSLYPG